MHTPKAQFQNATKPSQNGADQLNELLSQELIKVNTLITEQLQSEIPLIPELSTHLISAGGKRIRPLMTLAAGKLCHHDSDALYALAAAVEFIHTATLLHDDVVDESALRRGQATANKIWGNQPSVLVGDFLFSRAFELMVSSGSLEVLDCLSRTARIISEGEVHQLLTLRDLATTPEDYARVIGAKTARLFASATRLGPILAGLTELHKKALESYGWHIGMAFQLVDDLIDYFGTSDEAGKNTGDDFKEGKMTLPVILAYKCANEEEKVFWKRTLSDLKQEKQDFNQALAYLHHHKVYDSCKREADIHIRLAKESLSLFEESEIKSALIHLADYIGIRTA